MYRDLGFLMACVTGGEGRWRRAKGDAAPLVIGSKPEVMYRVRLAEGRIREAEEVL